MKKKTMWLTYLQLGVPFGVFLGYALTSVFVNMFNEVMTFNLSFKGGVLRLLKVEAGVLHSGGSVDSLSDIFPEV